MATVSRDFRAAIVAFGDSPAFKRGYVMPCLY